MRHLANAQYWDRPAGGNTGRLFLAFGGPVCADRFSNCPLDRVLTYKNLIYLLNLQFSRVARRSLPAAPHSRALSQDILRRWERAGREQTVMCNQAAGLLRCLTRVQDAMSTQESAFG